MKLEYVSQNTGIKVFIGRLNKDVELQEEANKLVWVDKNSDCYDLNNYAGEGNIWHIIHHAINNNNIDI